MKLSLFSIAISTVAVVSMSACNNTQPITHSPQTVPIVKHDKHHANHDKHAPTWSYDGATGPKFWGDVEGNEQCKIGQEQSPINISKVMIGESMAPKSSFGISNIDVTNNGHTVVYTPKDSNNTSLINGEVYTLKQFHYHAPSEHQISGVNYPAELHFVHVNKDGNLAVIGVMLNATAMTPALGSLISTSEMANEDGSPSLVSAINLAKLLPANPSFYHYEGSLTTPPCSEKVQWYVANQPLSVTNEEVVKLMQLYTGNNRPVQPQGSRSVTLVK